MSEQEGAPGWPITTLRACLCLIRDIRDIEILQRFFKAVLSDVDSLLEKYKSLSKTAIRKRGFLDHLQEDLEEAVQTVLRYVQRVCDMYRYASNERRVEEIKKGMEEGDNTHLKRFIQRLLDVYLKPADELCTEAQKALEAIRSSAVDSATNCSILATDAKSRKQLAWSVGGGIFLGGALVTIAQGFHFVRFAAFSTGIFHVVQQITANHPTRVSFAVFGVAVCFGSGYITRTISSEFATNESDLKELSQDFEKVNTLRLA